MPSWPLRNESAMALGTSASASTSLARLSSMRAYCSCSAATAWPGGLRLGPRDARVGLGLVGPQAGADVFAHVDIGDVDRDDFEGGVANRAAGPAPRLRIWSGFSSTSMWSFGLADGADDAFADAGDDRLFRRAADDSLQIGPHGHAGPHLELNAVAGDGVERLPPPRAGQSITLG